MNYRKIISFSLHSTNTEQKALPFGDKCIIKKAFHKDKRPISIDKVEIRRIVLSKKELYHKKRFI